MTAREVRTPVNYGPAVELGNGLWWKQVLPANKRIKYGDRFIDFNEQYCRNVAEAFGRKAFDTSPFVLAPETNSHTMAAQAGQYGEVLAAKVDMDALHPETGEPAPGLYYALKLEDEADQIVRRNPKFGVSVRVKENYTRADGEHFDAACQHLLGTWDPVLTGLSPWQPFDSQVDLSNPPGIAVIDLSAITFQASNEKEADVTAPTTTDTGQDAAPPPWFQQLIDSGALTLNGAGPATATGQEPAPPAEPDAPAEADDGDVDIDQMSDEEFDAFCQENGLYNDGAPAVESQQPAEVAASQTAGDTVDLANAYPDDPRIVQMAADYAATRRQLDASTYEREADDLVRRTGLPPHVIELARDVLEGTSHVVELSNDVELSERERAGRVMRNVLEEIGQIVQVLDLSESQGRMLAPADDDAVEKQKATRTRGAAIAGMIPG